MIATDLRRISIFESVPEAELDWFAKACKELSFKQGDTCYEQGDKVDCLIVLLEGTFNLVRYIEGKEVSNWLLEQGSVSGLLPFSRMKVHAASTYALTDCVAAEFPSTLFPDLQANAPTILSQLVLEMLDRSRRFTRENVEQEKLASLGTMAAGLAHELNNPASAVKRAAQTLKDSLDAFNTHSISLLADLFDDTKTATLNQILKRPTAPQALSSMQISDREDELLDYLDAFELEDAWNIASTFVAYGLSLQDLQELSKLVSADKQTVFLEWLYRDSEMRLLSAELLEGSSRVSELVGAMKQYSFMDRSQEKQAINLHEGLDNTLIILNHKLKSKGIEIGKHYGELSSVPAYGSELNQVWTNLLANAIDALPEGGKLNIETKLEAAAKVAIINIMDNGPGIPQDIQSRIFEPFFTTKGVGEGTGMGLDIVSRIIKQRHLGTIQLKSEPGFTCFSVRLPLS